MVWLRATGLRAEGALGVSLVPGFATKVPGQSPCGAGSVHFVDMVFL